jgi:acetylornithine deacetylase/succinyl-diaminopimelate desuccinylase-like protein
MAADLSPVLAELQRDLEPAVERLKALLSIPSIGTDPAFAPETRRAAEWLTAELRSIGFEASLRNSAGQPMVVAHHPGPGDGAPHGHYDVQPPEPLELWQTPPFVPTVVEAERGRRIVARGAVDDKGQVMTWIEAMRAWHRVHGSLPIQVSVFLEGEEESGSPSLEAFLAANRKELAADLCVVSDTNMWDLDTPAICTQLRGLLYVELTLHGPRRDLHSGLYGGAVPNPLNILTRILGQLHDDQGRVRIPGFYRDVRELSEEERAQLASLGFDEAAFLGEAGLSRGVGEHGRSTLERIWARPTCDLNGIWGGYIGEGSKTVIPAMASAKLSCRLVPDQDPEQILAGLSKFVGDRNPPDCRVEIERLSATPAMRIRADSPYVRAGAAALEQIFQRPPVLIGMGGSIPAVEAIKRLLGMDSLLVGFGLDDDRVHSPNEKFELACFERGVRAHAALLAELARLV